MRHRKGGKELSRNSSHRRAMLRNMVTSLFKYEQIETTDTKAKALRPVAEKMITLAKRGDLHARRQALAYIREKTVTHRLFDEQRDRYLDRQGGYVRIVKKGFRKGDGAAVSIVQLLPRDEVKKTGRKKRKRTRIKTVAGKGENETVLTENVKEAVESGDTTPSDSAGNAATEREERG